jgi:tRNA(fMet)-specific endonuclease VapC
VGALIDASVLIGFERSGEGIGGRITGREDEEFFVSVVTASELLHGVHRASSEGVRVRRSAFVEAILERFPILAIDVATARAHARAWAALTAAGKPIGAHDLWIAASCLAHGHSLVTLNVREFERVPGLRVEDWS